MIINRIVTIRIMIKITAMRIVVVIVMIKKIASITTMPKRIGILSYERLLSLSFSMASDLNLRPLRIIQCLFSLL